MHPLFHLLGRIHYAFYSANAFCTLVLCHILSALLQCSLGFDPRTVRPVASRYTDYFVATHSDTINVAKMLFLLPCYLSVCCVILSRHVCFKSAQFGSRSSYLVFLPSLVMGFFILLRTNSGSVPWNKPPLRLQHAWPLTAQIIFSTRRCMTRCWKNVFRSLKYYSVNMSAAN